MRINTVMPGELKKHYCRELQAYRKALGEEHWQQAWHYLERAHVLGQAYPFQHSQVHWLMLKFGIKIKDTREVLGQIPRLLVGGVKSFVGVIPIGNTGGANVPPLRPMEIPRDLQEMLSSFQKPRDKFQASDS